jgi:hypothetical protein
VAVLLKGIEDIVADAPISLSVVKTINPDISI